MKRLAAIQKSSRTRTTACSWLPSQCRNACTSCVSCSRTSRMEPLLELVEHHTDFRACWNPLPFTNPGQHFGQRQLVWESLETVVADL